MRSAPVLVAAGLLVILAAACGSTEGGSLGPPAPCPTVTIPATPQTGRDYRTQMNNGLASLQGALDDFRSSWPGTKFSRTAEFRTDFALYADTSVCLGEFLIAIPGPATWTNGEEAKLDGLLSDLLNTIREGREGVSKRNTSAYRRWNNRIGERMTAVREALNALPRGR